MSNHSSIFISIIIPVYNRAKTISYCLESVLEQSYPDYEVIIVDDFSSDNTLDIVNNYIEKDNRIKIVKLSQNSGAQKARNQGILSAKYDWIAFLDSDDKWEKNKLELQVEIIRQHFDNKFLLIHTDFYLLDQINNKKTVWNIKLANGQAPYPRLLEEYGPTFPSILTSKEALLKINLLDENVPSYQEWDTAISLSRICYFHHIQFPLFTYVIHQDETISKNKIKDIDGYLYIINKYKEDIIKINGLNFWHKHIEIVFRRSLDFELFKYASRIKKNYIDFENNTIQFLKFCLKNQIRPETSLNIYNKYQNKLYRVIWQKILWKIKVLISNQ